MFQFLKSLLGKVPREQPAKKPKQSAKSKPPNALVDYRAVSLVPGIKCCAAAKSAAGKRYLWRETPRLPLVECTMPADCSCKLHKTADRRDEERRLLGAGVGIRWFAGSEQRKRGGRRSKDR
jgi:hypothetical protein